MTDAIRVCGAVLAIIGMAIEVASCAAMVADPVRRRLPSPFTVLSVGGILFAIGVITFGIASVATE
jgi:hypothetical protein